MSIATLKLWVLAAFLALQPKAPPWVDTYARSAEAIANAAIASPLFDGPDGPQRTAAIMASVAWFESTLKPDAEGDCGEKRPDGTCKPGSRPHSFCLFQIGESNFAELGITREQIQTSVEVCADAAIRMMRISFGVCRARPLEERLGHYASGGTTCGGLSESRNRMRKGLWLFRTVRVPADDD